MSSKSEQQEMEIFRCVKTRRGSSSDGVSKERVSRRVSFQLDKNGEVVAHVLGESHGSECSSGVEWCKETGFIMQESTSLTTGFGGGIRMGTYANPMHSRGASSMDSSRFLELRNQFEKLTKTKADEISRGWRVQAPVRIKQENDLMRAGVYLQDGKFQPWFFGKITRRESEMLLSDTTPGNFLVRFSEKSSSCFTLSVRSGGAGSNTGGLASGGGNFHMAALNGSNGHNNHTSGCGTNGGGDACSSCNACCDLNNNNIVMSDSHVKHGGSSIRHFLILPDQTEYKLLGSAQTFTTLLSLIHHHGHSPITKSGNELLLEVCPKPNNFTVTV